MACEWISVNERFPTHEYPILFTDGIQIMKGYYHVDSELPCFVSDEYDFVECIRWFDTPTHWMPLPHLPSYKEPHER